MPWLSRWWKAPDPPLSPFETLNPLWRHVPSRLGCCVGRWKSGEDIPNIHQVGGGSTPCSYRSSISLGSKWQIVVGSVGSTMCVLTFSMHVPVVSAPPHLNRVWITHIPPESLLGISQCIPNYTRLTASTYVTVFALLTHLISIWAWVIDRMPSGLYWNNSAMSINHEQSMHTGANNVPAWGQHILSFCSFYVFCERCTLSRIESLSELLHVFKASRWSDAHTSSNLCAFAHRRRASKLTLASAAVCLFHCSAAMRWTALD